MIGGGGVWFCFMSTTLLYWFSEYRKFDPSKCTYSKYILRNTFLFFPFPKRKNSNTVFHPLPFRYQRLPDRGGNNCLISDSTGMWGVSFHNATRLRSSHLCLFICVSIVADQFGKTLKQAGSEVILQAKGYFWYYQRPFEHGLNNSVWWDTRIEFLEVSDVHLQC